MDFKKIREKLLKLDTSCLCDAEKRLRLMAPEIRSVKAGLKMIGIAYTVHCRGDFLSVIKALHEAVENEVLVIAAEGERIAFAGELFATEAKRKGLGGIVIDGGCRDVEQIRKINFPLYARFITPMAATSSKIFETQIAVTCGGVTVSPGDIIFGDDDGIVVIKEREIISLLDKALNIQRREEKVLVRMKNNESLIEMLNFSDHYEKIQKNQESTLTFSLSTK